MTTLQRSISFIKPLIEAKVRAKSTTPSLFIGVEGPQGSGKTTLSTKLTTELAQLYPALNFISFSMDDFYLTYDEQNAVTAANLGNTLLSGRGLPGTHDVSLLLKCLSKLKAGESEIDIPQYDKSQHSGRGDRKPFDEWIHIRSPVDVVIFEGWFNGYLAYEDQQEVLDKWTEIREKCLPGTSRIPVEEILQLNIDLAKYHAVWDYFNAFICITTDSIKNVYTWRLQQEHELISQKGTGMTDEQVAHFVDRYMPAYWLYYDRLDKTRALFNSLEIRIGLDRSPLRSLVHHL